MWHLCMAFGSAIRSIVLLLLASVAKALPLDLLALDLTLWGACDPAAASGKS